MNELEQINSGGMIPETPRQVATIVDSKQLAAFVGRMQKAPWIVVDTEFQRERTYYPELCLVQIAGSDEIGLIDTLAIDDLEPLAKLIGDADTLKIFHAADQDVEVLYQTLDVVPAPVFDTQIAAALLGLGDQIGYAGLVEKLTGTRLPKGQTRTDWTRRPLTDKQWAYAADDVRWLAVIHPVLRDRLAACDRLAWAQSDSHAMIAPERLQQVPADAWQRIRAWRHLTYREQQILARLAEWRERQAMQINRPRRWVLKDDAIVDLARKQPDASAGLKTIDALPAGTIKHHGEALLRAVAAGRQQPARPLAPDFALLDNAQKKLGKKARRALGICADRVGIAPQVLARRKELEQMVTGKRDLRVLSGWRLDMAGRDILAVVEGRSRIVGDGETAHFEQIESDC